MPTRHPKASMQPMNLSIQIHYTVRRIYFTTEDTESTGESEKDTFTVNVIGRAIEIRFDVHRLRTACNTLEYISL